VTEDSQAKPSSHSLLAHEWQPPVGELVKCFFMDSLLASIMASATPAANIPGGRAYVPEEMGILGLTLSF
jgi:hypothetical protein